MDLEREPSALEESVQDNRVMGSPAGKLSNDVETKIGNNGSCALDETKENGNQVLDAVKSPNLVPVKSSSFSPSPGSTKGKGLRKWRRIKREVSSEGGSNLDTTKLLKRVNPAANSNRPMQFSADIKQTSEGSVSSTNATMRNLGAVVDHFAAIYDPGFGISPALPAGMESENSEDRSSKSSTAASAPKKRYEMPMVSGFVREMNGTRSLSGKSFGNSIQRGHQGKVRTETSKKLRGEMVKIEKENSHSSMESDSQSSKFVFMQGNNSATSNGRQSGRSINYDGENSDEAQDSEWQLNEELQAGSNRKYGREFEVTSQEKLVAESTWGFKEEKSENNGPSRNVDPMAESIIRLQSVQEKLEKEVQKFREIGKEEASDDSVSDGSSDQQLQSGDLVQELSRTLEPEVASLTQAVNLLESKLDDATALLKVKEAKILELEGILNGRLLRGETGRTIELHQENYRDMEIELEGLFRQKIEAEVEYLAISRTIQKLKVAVVDQITILEEQKTEQARMMSKLEDTEAKAAMLTGLSMKLENYGEDIASAGETLKLKSKVCKYTSCFFLQLISLVLVLTLFLWQLYPHYTEVVPT